MQDAYNRYLIEEYKDGEEKLFYVDMGEIARHIVLDYKNRDTNYFSAFFEKVEEILQNCDDEVNALIVIGLFEDIQNLGGKGINYYTGFETWLKPIGRLKWEKVIDFWEGTDWRNPKT